MLALASKDHPSKRHLPRLNASGQILRAGGSTFHLVHAPFLRLRNPRLLRILPVRSPILLLQTNPFIPVLHLLLQHDLRIDDRHSTRRPHLHHLLLHLHSIVHVQRVQFDAGVDLLLVRLGPPRGRNAEGHPQ